MRKRITFFGAALVVVVLAALLVMQGHSPPTEAPPGVELPAVDIAPPPPSPARGTPVPVEAVASADPVPPTADDVPSFAGTAPDGSRRFMFECGKGVIFAIRVVPGEATVFSPQVLGGDVLTLPETDAVSGARYASGDDVFWNKGDIATFEVRGQSFVDCASNPSVVVMAEAHRRGIWLRALGNEPSWLLEISPERIVLTTELGQRRTEFPYREPTVTGKITTYRVFLGTQELLAVVDDRRCNDTMSGEAFDKTVAVTFGGATMYGCGGSPAALLFGRP